MSRIKQKQAYIWKREKRSELRIRILVLQSLINSYTEELRELEEMEDGRLLARYLSEPARAVQATIQSLQDFGTDLHQLRIRAEEPVNLPGPSNRTPI